jgi:hypothetical protein
MGTDVSRYDSYRRIRESAAGLLAGRGIQYDRRMTQRFVAATTIVLAIAVMLAVVANASSPGAVPGPAAQNASHQHGEPAVAAKAPAPMKAHTGPLPALPPISFEPPRPMAVVHEVYDFAARHPEVLRYVPCYCGCERAGHNGNHDCFIKSRDASGRVTAFDVHGMGCAICIDVARDALALFKSGATPVAIRAAIDQTWGTRFHSSTPTPRPQ